MISHLALALLLPAAWLTWRWSRLVSGALWLTLATWLAYESIKWQWPDVWAAGRIEWMRGVSMVTGLCGVVEIGRRTMVRAGIARGLQNAAVWANASGLYGAEIWRDVMANGARRAAIGRQDYLAALLVASMGVDLTAWLIHRGAGQWGPQPVFQVGVLLAMCAISVWLRRKP